jgi:hypothetical protein
MYFNWKTILFIIFIIIVVYYILWIRYDTFLNGNIQWSDSGTNVPCICVFDIDNTITCSLDQASSAIKHCKDNKCLIAISTARTEKYIKDIDLEKLGLDHGDLHHFYTGNYHKTGMSLSDDGLANHIAKTKVENLHDLHKKYNTPKNKIILLDDNFLNIEYAKKEGFSTVHANNPGCGLPFEIVSIIKNIVRD